jgi:hypothetical protein
VELAMNQENRTVCALCLKKRKLCRSHIIPEFFYKPIYDGPLRQFFVISTDPKEPTYPRQIGFRERLLCEECDRQRLGRVEDYSSKVLYGGVEIGVIPVSGMIKIEGLDYAKFKLFTMSLIWRASVTNLSHFSCVNIQPYDKTIRRMLLNGIPGEEYEFGCSIMGSPEIFGLSQKIIMPPNIEVNHGGVRYYSFVLGGMTWLFFLTNNANQVPYKEIFLTKNGVLPIFIDHHLMPEDFIKTALRMQKAGKFDKFKVNSAK